MNAEHLNAIRERVGKVLVVCGNGFYFCDPADADAGIVGKTGYTRDALKAKAFAPGDSFAEMVAKCSGGHTVTFRGV